MINFIIIRRYNLKLYLRIIFDSIFKIISTNYKKRLIIIVLINNKWIYVLKM